MLKFYYTFIIFVGVAFVSGDIVYADDAPIEPRCAESYDYKQNKPSKPTCKSIKRKIDIVNTSTFNKILFINRNYDQGEDRYWYSNHSNELLNQSRSTLETLYAIRTSDYAPKRKIAENKLFSVVVVSTDADIGRYGGCDELDVTYGPDSECVAASVFVRFPNRPYPFDAVPIISPIIEKKLIYSPFGFVRQGNKYVIVVYKAKEILSLDNGKKRTVSFKQPTIKGLLKTVPLGR